MSTQRPASCQDTCPNCLVRDNIPNEIRYLNPSLRATYVCMSCGHRWITTWKRAPLTAEMLEFTFAASRDLISQDGERRETVPSLANRYFPGGLNEVRDVEGGRLYRRLYRADAEARRRWQDGVIHEIAVSSIRAAQFHPDDTDAAGWMAVKLNHILAAELRSARDEWRAAGYQLPDLPLEMQHIDEERLGGFVTRNMISPEGKRSTDLLRPNVSRG